MRQLLLTIVALLLVVPASQAQDEWSFKESFTTKASSGHGIAVDPDGKIWWQPFSATDSVMVTDLGIYRPTRVLYVFNPDGSEADISPINIVDFSGTPDTLGGEVWRNSSGEKYWEGFSGRGLRADEDGNIVVSRWKDTWRLDYKTGAGLAKTTEGRDKGYCGVTAAAVSGDNGRVFIAPVCPAAGVPLIELNKDLTFFTNALDGTRGFSRSFEVSADGNKIYWAGYTTHAVILYERGSEFEPFDSVGVVVPGVQAESFGWQPGTGYLWLSAGCSASACQENGYPGVTTNWAGWTHYAFDPADLVVTDPITIPTPKAFFTWNVTPTAGRPRGIAFSPDGQMAYVTQFSESGDQQVQVFSAVPVAIEKLDDSVPDRFILMPAYPNPFNPSTNINFMLHEAGHARLAVYDVSGREVAVLADETMAPGTYQYAFDAAGLGSGVYLYRLEFGGQVATGRMTLVK